MTRDPSTARRTDLRPELWRVIRQIGAQGAVFTVDDLRGRLRGLVRRERIRAYVLALVNGGYLVPVPRPDAKPAHSWQLLRDPGNETPRPRRDGSPVIMGAGREQCWRAMRILKVFGIRELLAHANTERWTVAEAEARDYCDRLARAGLLQRDGQTYAFLPARFSGPRPPQIRRTKEVYDPNTGILYSKDGEILARGRPE